MLHRLLPLDRRHVGGGPLHGGCRDIAAREQAADGKGRRVELGRRGGDQVGDQLGGASRLMPARAEVACGDKTVAQQQ